MISNLTGGLTYDFKVMYCDSGLCIHYTLFMFIQVRARTSAGYGNFSTTKDIELPSETGNSEAVRPGNGGTIAVAVVFAILGWVILIATIVAVISAGIWYKRHRHTVKKL